MHRVEVLRHRDTIRTVPVHRKEALEDRQVTGDRLVSEHRVVSEITIQDSMADTPVQVVSILVSLDDYSDHKPAAI